MRIEDIEFQQHCCAAHDYAEVKTGKGWVAIMRTHGEVCTYSVRKYGTDKMPLDEGYSVVSEAELEALL